MKEMNVITEIYRIPVSSLTGVVRTSEDAVRIPQSLPWEKMEIKVPAEMEISDKIESKVHIYKVSVKCKALCLLPLLSEPSAYKVKTADGTWLLIGNSSRPFVIETRKRSFPSSLTDNQLPEVEISYTSDACIPLIT